MRNTIRLLVTFLVLVAVTQFSTITPISARGGGAANIMASPGYQRALEESRKRYRDSAKRPTARSQAVTPRKTWRHRGQRH